MGAEGEEKRRAMEAAAMQGELDDCQEQLEVEKGKNRELEHRCRELEHENLAAAIAASTREQPGAGGAAAGEAGGRAALANLLGESAGLAARLLRAHGCSAAAAGADGALCSVCRDSPTPGDDAAHPWVRLPCGHFFHVTCIVTSATVGGKPKCPNCRGAF